MHHSHVCLKSHVFTSILRVKWSTLDGERGRPFSLPFLFGSCLNASLRINIGLSWSNVCSLPSRTCFGICLFLSLFLCSELQLQVCPRLDFSSTWESFDFYARDDFEPRNFICNSRIFLSPNVVSWAWTCNTYVNSSDCAICILYRHFNMLSVSLSVTADNTSLPFVSEAWPLSFLNWTVDEYLKS